MKKKLPPRAKQQDIKSTKGLKLDRSLKSILDMNADALIIADKNSGKILEANKAAYELYGISKLQLLKKKFSELYEPVQKRKNLKNGISIHIKNNGDRFEANVEKKLIEIRNKKLNLFRVKEAKNKLTPNESFPKNIPVDKILNVSLTYVYLKDNKGRFVFINKNWTSFLGVDEKGFLGKTALDICCNAESAQSMYDEDIKIINKEIDEVEKEEKVVNKSGQTIWLHVFKKPLFDQNNSVNYILGFSFDITERKKIEEALKREAFIFDNLYDAVIICDLEGKIINWNNSAAQMYGYEKEEVLNLPVQFLNRGELDYKIENEIQCALKSYKKWSGEIKFYRKDGSAGISETIILPFKDNRGDTIAFIYLNRDITERKVIDHELKQSEERYKSLFDDSPIGLWEEDFSEVKKYLDDLLRPGITSLREYLESHPETLPELIEKVRIVDVNKASLTIHKAKDKRQFFNGLHNIIPKEGINVFKEEIIALYEGENLFEKETINYTLDKTLIHIYLRVLLVPGYEKTWSKVLVSIIDISERKKSETALIESENKFRKIAEKSLVGIYLIQDGTFKYINPKFAEIFGYDKEDIIDKISPADLAYKTDIKLISDNMKKRLSGNVESMRFDFKGITKNKKIIDIEAFGSRISYLGKPAVAGTLIDVTERKHAEEKLKENQKKYKELTDLLPQTVFEINLDGKFTFVNQASFPMFRYTQEDLDKGLYVYETVIPKDRGRAAANMLKVLKGEKIGPTEYTALRKDGTTFPAIIFYNPIIKEGIPYGWRGILIDITERKANEEELRKLSRAVEQSPASVVITDIFGDIQYVNPRFTELTGYEPEEVYGKNPRIQKSGETSKCVYEEMWDTITAGKKWRGEFHNKRKSGELYWEFASISPILNSEGKITHFLAIKEDITEKKLIEKELILAKEKAEESDRLKSEFLAQMSHEIRSPLNIIMSYNSFLKEELESKLSKDHVSAFASIDSAGKRLLRTMDLILNMSAVHAGYIEIKPEPVNLTKIISVLMKENEYHASVKNLSFLFNNKAGSTHILADDYIVTEIFQNLIGNAIKYTDKGKVEVTIYENHEKKLCVEVKDTGIGISKNYLPKLFVPFTQEETGYSRRFEGNGLGLALVKNYCDLLSARLKVESKKGAGTAFTVVFKKFEK